MGAGLTLGLAGALRGSSAQTRMATSTPLSLDFNVNDYTELAVTVPTDAGDRRVAYRFYRAIPYVARPVDPTFQSLNVSVPVAIDGVPVDATRAAILFDIGIGGYMPLAAAEAGGIAGGRLNDATGLLARLGINVGGGGGRDGNRRSNNAALALAAGCVVVEPGARGRTLVDRSGNHYGAAPAGIVDLKAAVRYVRFNRGRIPGDTERIVTSGISAGGAFSALLGTSADSPLYEARLAEIGAAEASDSVFACGAWCPIIDLEHADMAYEWNWGTNPLRWGELADRTISRDLRAAFFDYQAGLALEGQGGFGQLTAANYDDYLLQTYLQPAATRYLAALSPAELSAYLSENPSVAWSEGRASLTWAGFLDHVGARRKNTPAFDALDLSSVENSLFGRGAIAARHFTAYSLRRATGNPNADIDDDLPATLDMMNPMFFLRANHPGRSKHWWIRVGAKDSDTSLTVVGNLAAALQNRGAGVNAEMYWDGRHGANEDAGDFIRWIGEVTGYLR